MSALLAAALAPAVGGDTGRALDVWRRDAPHHPSPNAGPVEAAFAGALDVRLGGVNTYRDRVEDRHTLGDGRPVEPDDITRSVRLAELVGAAALGVAALIAAAAQSAAACGSLTTSTPAGTGAAADDDDRGTPLGGDLHLRPGVGAAGVLGDDDVDVVLVEQSPLVVERGTARG